MSKMGTVLEFKARNGKNTSAAPATGSGPSGTNVEGYRDRGFSGDLVDMTERREAILNDERRRVKRTILAEFVGASCVIPGLGLERVVLYDVSESGMAFDIEDNVGHFRVGEEVAMRLYLNHETYFPFTVTISNVRQVAEDGVYRHGGRFAEGTMNSEALHHFVRFIETVSAYLKTDSGDIMVSNIR